MDLKVIFVTLAFFTCIAASKKTKWFGFGDEACYGQTCMLDEFCSDNSVYLRCRSCNDVKEWCDKNMDYVRSTMPSCEALCERERSRKMAEDFQAEKEAWQAALQKLESEKSLQSADHNQEGNPTCISTQSDTTLNWLHYILMGIICILGVPLFITCVRKLRRQGNFGCYGKPDVQVTMVLNDLQSGENEGLLRSDTCITMEPDRDNNMQLTLTSGQEEDLPSRPLPSNLQSQSDTDSESGNSDLHPEPSAPTVEMNTSPQAALTTSNPFISLREVKNVNRVLSTPSSDDNTNPSYCIT